MVQQETIRFIKPWGLHPKGATITVDPPIALGLIASGRAEAVKEPAPVQVKADHKGKRNEPAKPQQKANQ